MSPSQTWIPAPGSRWIPSWRITWTKKLSLSLHKRKTRSRIFPVSFIHYIKAVSPAGDGKIPHSRRTICCWRNKSDKSLSGAFRCLRSPSSRWYHSFRRSLASSSLSCLALWRISASSSSVPGRIFRNEISELEVSAVLCQDVCAPDRPHTLWLPEFFPAPEKFLPA